MHVNIQEANVFYLCACRCFCIMYKW